MQLQLLGLMMPMWLIVARYLRNWDNEL